jgi:enoyl-CoA hydratase/carnithine racemase
METIDLVLSEARAEVYFNRPEVLNAANCQWMDDLHAVLDELESTDRLRVVIFSGRGRAFSTGVDLKALSSGEIHIGWFRLWEEAMRRIEMLQPVTIARVNGYALGGGLQVCLACDLRVASEEAQFGLPAVLEALIPGTGTYRLPRFIGLGRARRMILTGETVGAQEALEIGLTDWVVPANQLVEQTDRIVQGVLEGSRTAQCLSKRLATMSFETPMNTFCELYVDYQSQAMRSEDHRVAMERLREKYAKKASPVG